MIPALLYCRSTSPPTSSKVLFQPAAAPFCLFLQNFFVCGRTLPLWIVVFALLAQGLDSNATLGNVALSYK
jgi:hypothetical protein